MPFETLEENKEKKELPNEPKEIGDHQVKFVINDFSQEKAREREEDLRDIAALEKKSGLNLDETELEIQGEINEALFSSDLDPKQEKIKYEKMVADMKDDLIKQIGGQDYLNKLKIEFGSNLEKAKAVQKERISNLRKVKITIVSLKEVNDRYRERTADSGKLGNFEGVGGFYDPVVEKHEIVIPFDTDSSGLTALHELLHASTRSNSGISSSATEMLRESYVDQKKYFGLFGDDNNEYYKYTTERLVRKQMLDRELEKLGIKKYGEMFTGEHYNKMMKLYKDGKFSRSARDFIERTDPKKFVDIFNKVAANEEDAGSAEEKAA